MVLQVMLMEIKMLSNIIMTLDQYDVVLDRVIYKDYKFLVNQMKKKMKGLNDKKANAVIKSAKVYVEELKYRIIVNEEYLKKEFKLITWMASMPQKELDQKFNQVMNDPDNKTFSDDVKKMAIAAKNDKNDKILFEADRLDKNQIIKRFGIFIQKNTRKYKRYVIKRISGIPGKKLKNKSKL